MSDSVISWALEQEVLFVFNCVQVTLLAQPLRYWRLSVSPGLNRQWQGSTPEFGYHASLRSFEVHAHVTRWSSDIGSCCLIQLPIYSHAWHVLHIITPPVAIILVQFIFILSISPRSRDFSWYASPRSQIIDHPDNYIHQSISRRSKELPRTARALSRFLGVPMVRSLHTVDWFIWYCVIFILVRTKFTLLKHDRDIFGVHLPMHVTVTRSNLYRKVNTIPIYIYYHRYKCNWHCWVWMKT